MKRQKQKLPQKRKLVLHTFFLAACLPLFLLVPNLDQRAPVQLIRPLLVTLSLVLVLLGLHVFNITIFLIQSGGRITTKHVSPLETLKPYGQSTCGDQVDIYNIIVNGHGCSDVVQAQFKYANAELIGNLKGRGFFAACSNRSKHVQMTLLLAPSLKLDYVNYLGNAASENYLNRYNPQFIIPYLLMAVLPARTWSNETR